MSTAVKATLAATSGASVASTATDAASRSAAIQRMASAVLTPAFHDDDDGDDDVADDNNNADVDADSEDEQAARTAPTHQQPAASARTTEHDVHQEPQHVKQRPRKPRRQATTSSRRQHQQMLDMQEMQQMQMRQFEALMMVQPSAYRKALASGQRLLAYSGALMFWGLFLIGLTVATMELVKTTLMTILLVVLAMAWPMFFMVLVHARRVLLGTLPMVDRKTGHVIPPDADTNQMMEQMLALSMPQVETKQQQTAGGAAGASAGAGGGGASSGTGDITLSVGQQPLDFLQQQQQQQQQQPPQPVMAQADDYQKALDHLTAIGMLCIIVPFLQQITIDRSLDEIIFALVQNPDGIFSSFNRLAQGPQAIYILQFINYVFTILFSGLMLWEVFALRTYYTLQKGNCKTPPSLSASAQLQQYQLMQQQQLLQMQMRLYGGGGGAGGAMGGAGPGAMGIGMGMAGLGMGLNGGFHPRLG